MQTLYFDVLCHIAKYTFEKHFPLYFYSQK